MLFYIVVRNTDSDSRLYGFGYQFCFLDKILSLVTYKMGIEVVLIA